MKIKQYKRKPTKLLQIRMSEEEYKEITDFIKKFGVTQRMFILAAKNELEGYNIIKNGVFYGSHKSYAYSFRDEWDKKIDRNSECELCGQGYYEYGYSKGHDDYSKTLLRHHHDGYEGENAYKTHILCRKCHGICHRKENACRTFDDIKNDFVK